MEEDFSLKFEQVPCDDKPITIGYNINTGYYICNTCLNHIKCGKVPPCSAENKAGLAHFKINPELCDLTPLEARLVSPRIPFMWIKTKPVSNMKAVKGNLCCVPADVETTVESLPRSYNESDIILSLIHI